MANGVTSWAQLLHFYQPPTQSHDVLERVVEECYRPVLAVIGEHANAKIAVSINAVLTELLHQHGFGDVLGSLTMLAERGQIEFVGSGRFHPILPLVPETERRRSIAENAKVNRALIGPGFAPRGFFPPELCYSAEILPAVVNAGHEWVVVSGVAAPDGWPSESVCRIHNGGAPVAVLFRDDHRSNRISFRETNPGAWIEDLAALSVDGVDRYVLTAMDAETFGHHISGWERDFLGETYEGFASGGANVCMVMPSELVDRFPVGPTVEPHRSSWSTSPDDIAARNPYPLWQAPGNDVHALEWECVEHCLGLLATARRYRDTADEAERFTSLAEEALQPALHSCWFWWASRRPWFDVPMIQRGSILLQSAILYAARAVELSDAPATVKKETRWRLSAANATRVNLERRLIADTAP